MHLRESCRPSSPSGSPAHAGGRLVYHTSRPPAVRYSQSVHTHDSIHLFDLPIEFVALQDHSGQCFLKLLDLPVEGLAVLVAAAA